MKRIAGLMMVACVLVSQGAFAGVERERGFYFDAGLGSGSVSYGDDLDNALELLDGLGADRTTIYLDLGIGYALTPNLYATGSISAFGDRFEYKTEMMQLNTYLYGLGVKYYPFGKGLQLGASAGAGVMILSSSEPEFDGADSERTYGTQFSVAYDFDSTDTGPAVILGLTVLSDFFEDETVTGTGLFAKFVFK